MRVTKFLFHIFFITRCITKMNETMIFDCLIEWINTFNLNDKSKNFEKNLVDGILISSCLNKM
jgi:hypothetical protein